MRDPVYLDTSAVVKLAVDEPESEALRSFLRELDAQLTTSVIAEIESIRAISRAGGAFWKREIFATLERFVILPLSEPIRSRAALLEPLTMRSLDAIHLATAIELERYLCGFVCYDNRLNDAARAFGLTVEAPV